ncbi:glycosyltransferase, partial [Streptomyces sp. NPDC050704]|uniref:glycosyltransferase n=1 Tax=Streptomyces sp. NPDC050704 TaxID=3157219 RepID=UPI00344216A7
MTAVEPPGPAPAAPVISVVVPTRDQAARLEATLHAFTRQDAPPGTWELVVVDDGSGDTTPDVLRAAARSLPLRALRTSANGRAAARNAGAAAGRGAVLVFCDGDRAPVPGYVRAHALAHGLGHPGEGAPEPNGRKVVVGDVQELYLSAFEERLAEVKERLTGDGWDLRRGSRTPAFVKKVHSLYDDSGRSTSPVRWLSFLSGNVSLSRSLFGQVGGFDEDFTQWGLEHLELGYRLVAAGAEFRRCAAARNDHFAHGRPAGFYRRALEDSAALFARKHPEVPAELLLDLTLGGLSVAQFEQSVRGPARGQGPHAPPDVEKPVREREQETEREGEAGMRPRLSQYFLTARTPSDTDPVCVVRHHHDDAAPTVVLMTGLALSMSEPRYLWSILARRLRRLGLNVVQYDHPGHADSAATGRPADWAALRDAARAVRGHARASGGGEVMVVGCGIGTVLAAELLAAGAVTAGVLVCPDLALWRAGARAPQELAALAARGRAAPDELQDSAVAAALLDAAVGEPYQPPQPAGP